MNSILLLAMFPLFAPNVDDFEYTLVTGRTVNDVDWFNEGEGAPRAPEAWLSLCRNKHPRPAWPDKPQLIFANGDRIAGTLLRGDDRTITLKTAWGELAVPMSVADILWVKEPPAESTPFPDRYSWLKLPRTKDVVLLANGDTLSGDLETFSDIGNLKIAVDGTSRTLPKDRIVAIAFNPALTVKKKLKDVWYEVVTRDGSRIMAMKKIGDKESLKLTTTFGETITLPWSDVNAIDRRGEDVTLLEDLKPVKAEVLPFLDVSWRWAAGRSVKQNPLRIQTAKGVETFPHGLGTHPKTTLTYDLAGKYRDFDSLVGMDAVTGRRGTAVIRVMIDDKAQEPISLSATESKRIHFDVSKAKTLTLIIDFGPGGDVQADVNWVNAVLMK
ncbi:hypothetical protein BH11PLA2_BH11PLA2_24760 [soil metagenome]